MRHTKKIKIPRQAPPPRPKGQELREIYKGLLTADQGQRLAKLAQAMAWYDSAQPYLLFKTGNLTPEQLKDDNVAQKCRARGISTTFNHEKETSFAMALRRYEKVFSLIKPIKIEPFLTKLKEEEIRLQQKQAMLEAKFGSISDMIAKAFKPTNAEGTPIEIRAGEVEHLFQIDPARSTFTMNRQLVKTMRNKRFWEGLLPMLLEVLVPISRMCVMEAKRDPSGAPTGEYQVDARKQVSKMKELMDNLITYAKQPDSPKRMVRKTGGVKVRVKSSSTGGTGRVWQGKRTKVDGLFVEGSDVAKLYTTMLDGQWHEKSKLQTLITSSLYSRLRKIGRALGTVGKYKLEVTQDKARLVKQP